MTKRQQALLLESIVVLCVAFVAILALINLKDWTNRREALRAMAHIAEQLQTYRQENDALPPATFMDSVRASVPGRTRLGKLEYRGQDLLANPPDTAVLAYTKQTYQSRLIRSGYIVIYLNGQVRWLTPAQFENEPTEPVTEADSE